MRMLKFFTDLLIKRSKKSWAPTSTQLSVSTDTLLDRHVQSMLRNLSAVRDVPVGDIMVPRADIIAVPADADVDDIIECFKKSEHSRLPVYRETLDDPIGFLHIKDLFSRLRKPQPEPFSSAALAREVLCVPPSVTVPELLLQMQARRVHMALIVDEYGGTDGLATIEDLVEQIVGRIDDEHDNEQPSRPTCVAPGIVEVDARQNIKDLADTVTAFEYINAAAQQQDVDTIGGLLAAITGRVPQRGEIIPFMEGVEFAVLEADPRRIRRVRILEEAQQTPAPTSAQSQAQAATGNG